MKNTKLIIYPLFLLLLAAGCDSFVEVDLPSGQLTTPVVFEDRTTANAAMADVYAKLRDSGPITGTPSGVSNLMGNYADEFDYYGSVGAGTASFYTNSLVATNGTVAALWNESYNEIYSANAILEGVAASTGLQQQDKDELTGEALFVRALVHFNLVNLYGPVPYITTTNYSQNRKAYRMPPDSVYEHIITDLLTAQDLLPENYISSERIRPNKFTVTALISRVYLYHGDWAEASNAASAVLNSSLYAMENNLDRVFLKGSSATIWQLKSMAEGINTYEGSNFIITTGPPSFVALSSNLVSVFENGDQRLSHWVGSVTDGTTVWYYANKYKEKTSTGSSVEYSIVFRLAEQYLIRAEARARQGELINATDDLNVIRHFAGLGDSPAVNQQEILEAIQRERRVELFTESGHRFFDLKRTGMLDAALSPLKPGWSSSDQLLPIPEAELLLNPNLAPQNLGY